MMILHILCDRRASIALQVNLFLNCMPGLLRVVVETVVILAAAATAVIITRVKEEEEVEEEEEEEVEVDDQPPQPRPPPPPPATAATVTARVTKISHAERAPAEDYHRQEPRR